MTPNKSNGQAPDRLSLTVRTLVASGFVLQSTSRNPGYALLIAQRSDEFGAVHTSAFAVAENRPLTDTEVAACQQSARYNNAQLVVVGSAACDVPSIPWDRFVTLFGGAIHSTSALDPDFGAQLVELGHNRLPVGLNGRPDDLFEQYVWSGLEFILAGRVVRYGQNRRFEARPDGVALPHNDFCAIYDAKAYSNGYDVTADGVRQFKSYVADFRARYSAYFPRLNAFIVISGGFVQGEQALRERYEEFVATEGMPLTFMTAQVFREIITATAERPSVRRSINWAKVFASPLVNAEVVRDEITAVERDGIVGIA